MIRIVSHGPGIIGNVRALALSLLVHALALAAVWPTHSEPVWVPPVQTVTVAKEPVVVAIALVELPDARPSGGASAAGKASRPGATVDPDGWKHVSVRMESRGIGTGQGEGRGTGIGFGDGGGVGAAHDVPAPPPPPPPPAPAKVSKARPAKLIFPTRNRDVEDQADLFIARITVDTDGDVVGARMTKTRPGVRGDQAANAIWTFRYLPALNDDGVPIASTFEQEFQIR